MPKWLAGGGAQVPFRRPAELAQDDTPGIDPVLHALEQLPDFDAVLLLQPTSPLRTTEDIDACIGLAQDMQAASVVSVSEPGNIPTGCTGWEPISACRP